jgi:hypothetical protein
LNKLAYVMAPFDMHRIAKWYISPVSELEQVF